jgi:hypothetical protein
MARKSTKLTLTPQSVTDFDSQYNKLKKVTLSTGFTEISTSFRPSTVDSLLLDLSEFLAEYEKNGGKITDNDTVLKFLYLHILKYFSNLCPIFPETFEDKLDFMNKLSDHPCVIELQDHFDPKEIAKVYNVMFKKLEGYQKLMEQDSELKSKFNAEIDKLDNAELIRTVMFGNGDTAGNLQ